MRARARIDSVKRMRDGWRFCGSFSGRWGISHGCIAKDVPAEFWVLETSAAFLDKAYDPSLLQAENGAFAYGRGYFDADGGMPRDIGARLYFQFAQRDRLDLERLRLLLTRVQIECGAIHNPSPRVAPDYWRFYVRARCHESFMTRVHSRHPDKRPAMQARLDASARDDKLLSRSF
jgi:hypothetical protein